MIIDAKTVIFTLIVVGIAAYAGLGFIRSFALSIAQENHDANLAMDMTEEARRARRERDADAAASAAFAKVEPLLPSSVVTKGMSLSKGQGPGGAASTSSRKMAAVTNPTVAPIGGLNLSKKSETETTSPDSGDFALAAEASKTDIKDDSPLEEDEEAPMDESSSDLIHEEGAAEDER